MTCRYEQESRGFLAAIRNLRQRIVRGKPNTVQEVDKLSKMPSSEALKRLGIDINYGKPLFDATKLIGREAAQQRADALAKPNKQ